MENKNHQRVSSKSHVQPRETEHLGGGAGSMSSPGETEHRGGGAVVCPSALVDTSAYKCLCNLLQNLLDFLPNGLLYKGLFTAVMVCNS